MPTVAIWPFLLVDPPSGGETLVREALAANSFDWTRIANYVVTDTDDYILVKWQPLDNGAQARFDQYTNEVLFDTYTWQNNLAMTKYAFTHECGHLIDYAYLNNMKRQDFMALMVAEPDHASIAPHPEVWHGGYETFYWARVHEGWADVWACTYAPDLVLPLFLDWGRYQHKIRNKQAQVKAIMDRSDTVQIEQWAGASRYETAQVASMNRYPQMPTPVTVVVAADGTPDAQTAASVAGQTGWTYLLHPNASTTAQTNTLTEITRLKPTRIVYVGGTTPIPQTARDVYNAAAQP